VCSETSKRLVAIVAFLLVFSVSIAICLQDELPLNSDSIGENLRFGWSPLHVNATQGESFVVTGTLFSDSDHQPVKAGLGYQLACIDNVSYWENASIWGQILNATFTPNPVLLESRKVTSVTLTITLAEDAPTGEYHIFLQGIKNHLHVFVTPKAVTENT